MHLYLANVQNTCSVIGQEEYSIVLSASILYSLAKNTNNIQI